VLFCLKYCLKITRCQNTLDLVLADVERVVTHVGQKPPIGRSDHAAADMMFDLVRAGKHMHKPDTQTRYLWHHADYDVMYEYLAGVDWLTMVCHHSEASQSWSTFNRLLTEAVNVAVPIAASCQHRSTKACDSRAVRNSVLQKRKVWNNLLSDHGIHCCARNTESVYASTEIR